MNSDDEKKSNEKGNNLDNNDGPKKSVRYWLKLGFETAGQAKGNRIALQSNLEVLYQNFKIKSEYDTSKTESFRQKYKAEKVQLETDKDKLIIDKENLENTKIPEIKDKIGILIDEINDIKQNPSGSLHIEKPDKLGFYLGLLIFIFLTVDLWIFYSSAIYSAFFRKIDFTQNVVLNTIFYAKSFIESLNTGAAAFILILVSPFIFLALGYLIHKFLEEKKITGYLKMVSLLLVTFIFDCILAYEITSKIYDAIIINSPENMPPYNLSIAIHDVNFWLIIFAGFVVYIVWGLILTFVTEGFQKFDVVKVAVKRREDKIKEHKNEIINLNTKIYDINTKIESIKGEIKKAEAFINSKFFDFVLLENNINSFWTGWLNYLTGMQVEQQEINAQENIKEDFIKKIKSEFK